ncbi:MAG TPA: condensation domain-containing protein, partial [Puia sp.]|uniref:condensation domain-containing protein n=1 Tax=Puia sp. TaxID=2045100 RepID=UPI002BF250DF
MSVLELMEQLKQEKIRINVEGSDLKISAGKDSLTKDILEKIRSNKQELIGFLSKTVTDAAQRIEAIPDAPYYRVSCSQKRLWMMDQLAEQKSVNNILYSRRYRGHLDTTTLGLALKDLIHRHEILRTIFFEEGSAVYQRVLMPSQAVCEPVFIDISAGIDKETRIRSLIDSENGFVFDLGNAPLLRMVVARQGESDYWLILTMHHIISDQWSGDLFLRQLIGAYEQYQLGEFSPAPPARLQYRDYAAWQNDMLERPAASAHRVYWLHQLNGDLPKLQLPADYPRPRVKTAAGAHHRCVLDPTLVDRLVQLARQNNCSLFTVLLATITTLLYRYTGTEDLILGVPVAGRDHRDLEEMLGCFINTLPIRSRFQGQHSFRDLIGITNQTLLAGYSHQAYPFDQLVEDLNIPGDRSRSPLFDVLVNFNAATIREPLPTTTGNDSDEAPISKFDCSFFFTQYSNGLTVAVNYSTDLFTAERISRLLDHYSTLLHSITLDPDRPIQSLEYLSAAEQQLLKQFNATDTPVDLSSSLVELWEQAVDRFTHAPALRCDQLQLS